MAVRLLGLVEVEHAVLDRERLAGRDDVDAAGLGAVAVLDLHDPHRRVVLQNLGELALVVRREVLDEHERHPRPFGERPEKLRVRLQPARRRADGHDREGLALLPVQTAFCRGRTEPRLRCTGASGREGRAAVSRAELIFGQRGGVFG